MPTQREKADLLRKLHRRGEPLVLVNIWDAVSARIIEELGFPAVATTSAGISWLEGYADGERLPRENMLAGVARVTRAVEVPVTADVEAGYGPSVEDAIATAKGAIAAGAVGLNFEDWDPQRGALADIDAQSARIAAMRKAADETGVPLVINARTDVFLRDVGDGDEWRLEEAIRRGNRYLEAGADCAFVPGVTDERTIATLANEIKGPINVLAASATPTVARLGELGVARISLGASAMAHTLTQFRHLATEVRETGDFQFIGERLSHAEVNALFP
jgi:2-methylisocitrate lyase-like PEP mutase family enzyme